MDVCVMQVIENGVTRALESAAETRHRPAGNKSTLTQYIYITQNTFLLTNTSVFDIFN